MTYNLYKMFKERYPERWNSFSIYEANERIKVILRERVFLSKKKLINEKEINDISEKYFKRFYKIGNGEDFGLEGVVVFLNPEDKMDYEKYDNHHFWIPRFSSSLEMEISTGNRGRSLLTQSQRMKYFWFVNSLFDKMRENALKD